MSKRLNILEEEKLKKADALSLNIPAISSSVLSNFKLTTKMKKYRIELSEQQMRLIADCLEDVSRFASGQWEMRYTVEEMLRGLPFDEQMKRRSEVEELLKQTKRVLLPDYPDNASKGYNGSEFIGNTYQIYRTILHQLAKDNDWNNVYSSSALPSGNLGTIKIESVDVS